MTMTDPIADMLTRLRNANQAYHDAAVMPSSKLKTHIAEILQQEGYIAGWNVSDAEATEDLGQRVRLRVDPQTGLRDPPDTGGARSPARGSSRRPTPRPTPPA